MSGYIKQSDINFAKKSKNYLLERAITALKQLVHLTKLQQEREKRKKRNRPNWK